MLSLCEVQNYFTTYFEGIHKCSPRISCVSCQRHQCFHFHRWNLYFHYLLLQQEHPFRSRSPWLPSCTKDFKKTVHEFPHITAFLIGWFSRFFRYVTPTPTMIELHWLKLDLAVKDRWPIELLAYSNHGGSWRLVESLVDGKWIKFDNLKLVNCISLFLYEAFFYRRSKCTLVQRWNFRLRMPWKIVQTCSLPLLHMQWKGNRQKNRTTTLEGNVWIGSHKSC